MDLKLFMKQLKAIWYQLFNRKLPFIIIDKLQVSENVYRPRWLFTNIDYETMLMYDSKPDYFFSEVISLNEEFNQKFYELFPIFTKETSFYIQIVDFMSSLSKADDISKCTLDVVENKLVLTYFSKEETISKTVGIPLLDIDAEMYRAIWASGALPPVCPSETILKESDLQQSVFIKTIKDGSHSQKDGACHTPRDVKVIIQVGLTVPDLPRFLKNMGLTDEQYRQCKLEAGYRGDSVLVTCHYDNPYICCNTTQPAQRWFVHHNYSIEKESDYGRK